MYYQQLKDKVLLQLKYLKTGDTTVVPEINSISEMQVVMMAPKIFTDGHPDNCIHAIDASFESLCTNLEELGVNNPKKLTVFEFYSKIAYFKKKKAVMRIMK